MTRQGTPVGIIDPEHRAEGAEPARRFWDVLVRTMRTFEIFGLIRADVLRRTRLHGNYYGSDKVLLAELSLHGRFNLLPDVLMYRRCHPSQSSLLSVASKSLWSGAGRRREHWLSLRLRRVIPGYLQVFGRRRSGSTRSCSAMARSATGWWPRRPGSSSSCPAATPRPDRRRPIMGRLAAGAEPGSARKPKRISP